MSRLGLPRRIATPQSAEEVRLQQLVAAFDKPAGTHADASPADAAASGAGKEQRGGGARGGEVEPVLRLLGDHEVVEMTAQEVRERRQRVVIANVRRAAQDHARQLE